MESDESQAMRLAKNPMASASDAPSRESHPNSTFEAKIRTSGRFRQRRIPARAKSGQTVPLPGTVRCRWHGHRRPLRARLPDAPFQQKICRRARGHRRATGIRHRTGIVMRTTLHDPAPNTYSGQWTREAVRNSNGDSRSIARNATPGGPLSTDQSPGPRRGIERDDVKFRRRPDR